MSIWYSRRKKEEKSLRLAAAGKSAFCFAELHYNARSYLASDEEGTKFFPMLKARIQSLENTLGETVPLSSELGYLNASFQYALGKRMVTQAERKPLSAFFERILSKN